MAQNFTLFTNARPELRLAPPGAVLRGAPAGGCTRLLRGAFPAAGARYAAADEPAAVAAWYDAALRARGWVPAPGAVTGSTDRAVAVGWRRDELVLTLAFPADTAATPGDPPPYQLMIDGTTSR